MLTKGKLNGQIRKKGPRNREENRGKGKKKRKTRWKERRYMNREQVKNLEACGLMEGESVLSCWCVGGVEGRVIRGHLCGLRRQSSAHNGAVQFASMKNRCSREMKWHMHLQRETDKETGSSDGRGNKPSGLGRWQGVCAWIKTTEDICHFHEKTCVISS